MCAILLKNITIENSCKDVLIDKGVICRIEPAGSCAGWNLAGDIEIMQCAGKVAVPGFINMHVHSPMTLMRGMKEDVKFPEWLANIWEIEANIDKEFVYWGTKVACLEMIKTGTTTFNDHYWHHPESYRAASEMGLRIATGYEVMDKDDPVEAERQKDQCIRMFERARKEWCGNSIYQVAFHAIYSVSEELMLWISDFAKQHNLHLHIHLSETAKEIEDCKALHGGLSPVEYLDRLGILGPNLIAAHTLWVSDNDIRLLADRGVHCVHNINSNTKLASGYRFRYNEMRDAGINICLGTDGCASSNNLDMLEVMKTSALFQKSWRDDPTAMPLPELLDCATVNGARALGLNTGRLEVGAIADLSIVDTDNSFFLSPAPFLANFVYSAHSDCIESVICNGEFIMRGREIKGEKEIYEQARKVLSKIS